MQSNAMEHIIERIDLVTKNIKVWLALDSTIIKSNTKLPIKSFGIRLTSINSIGNRSSIGRPWFYGFFWNKKRGKSKKEKSKKRKKKYTTWASVSNWQCSGFMAFLHFLKDKCIWWIVSDIWCSLLNKPLHVKFWNTSWCIIMWPYLHEYLYVSLKNRKFLKIHNILKYSSK